MASKPKSALPETPNKTSSATPRVTKPGARGVADSHSPLQSSRLSLDRSPRTVPSKPAVDRRSPKLATPPEKQPTRLAKGSDQLSLVQEDLKKAKEQLISAEKEKAKALEELREAQRVAEEANEKLREAVVAQKRAEESSEIEKFRAVELEQSGIEAARKKEEEWEKEVKSVKDQQAADVAALLTATRELERLKQELAMTCDAKDQALSHADDATNIAEIQAKKAEALSAEVSRLKAALDLKIEAETNQNNKVVLELSSEVASLKHELDKAKSLEEKVIEKDVCIENLNVELEAARMAESYARSVVEKLNSNVEELERQVEEAHKLERSASESLELVMKQLEGSNDLLHDARSEVSSIKGKMGLLEITIERQKVDLEESELCIGIAKDETSEMAKLVESLKSELQVVKEEKSQALNNEKLSASKVQAILEEKSKLANELENSKNEEDKSKKAMESLASALHEVSAEAREAKEKLLSIQVEHDSYETQIEDLKLVLKATNEKYETLLDEAKLEADSLRSTIEQSKTESNDSRAEWEEKELHLVSCVKKSEEENSSLQKEVNKLVNLLKYSEEDVRSMKEVESRWKDSLHEVESEVVYLQGVLAEAKSESMKLKESVLDKESEIQNIIQENDDLRAKEAAALKKAEEASKLLDEALAKKELEENGEISDSEKDYDLLPKVVEFSEENGHVREEKLKVEREEPRIVNIEHNSKAEESGTSKVESLNGKEEEEDDIKEREDEFKMWESCKIEKKEFSPEQESVDEEVESKMDGSESFDQISGAENNDDGGSSPTKQQQKKKKPLLRKFGSLLKKKGSSTSNNHK